MSRDGGDASSKDAPQASMQTFFNTRLKKKKESALKGFMESAVVHCTNKLGDICLFYISGVSLSPDLGEPDTIAQTLKKHGGKWKKCPRRCRNWKETKLHNTARFFPLT